MNSGNAIQREIEKLTEHWQIFTDGNHSILHWLIKSTDVPLANTFIKIKEQFDEDTGEWFIQLSSEFSGLQTYAYDLAEELNQLMEEGVEEANEETPIDDWKRPNLSSAQSGFHALFLSCDTILKTYDRDLELLTLTLAPTAVKNANEYRQWWDWVCKIRKEFEGWNSKLKFLVIDSAERPFLHDVLIRHPEVALTQNPPLDFNGAARDIAEKANDGTDGGKFRLHLLDMNNAIAASDKKTLEKASEDALSLATKNQWMDMAGTVLMTRASGWLNFKIFDQAVNDYRLAQQYAAQGMANKTPGCDKLLLQAMLFEGTAYFMANYLEHAGKAYENTAKKASELKDQWIELEAWRMASLSWERAKNKERAWQHGTQALAVGRGMKPEERGQSSLAFVGQAMLRLSPNAHVSQEVKHTFDQWLGEGWLEQVESATS